jgi:hypothetical protein
MTDITNDFTTATDDAAYDAQFNGQATGGYNSTVLYNQIQPTNGYRFDEIDCDIVGFFLDLAKVIENQSDLRSLNGDITMNTENCVFITDGRTLANIHRKLVANEIYYDRVSINGGFRVPELGGFTFVKDNKALSQLSKTWNSVGTTKGFGIVFDAGNVPFYAKQYFLGAQGWARLANAGASSGFGLEYFVDPLREGDVEVLYQAYFKAIVERPDELFVLGNLRSA